MLMSKLIYLFGCMCLDMCVHVHVEAQINVSGLPLSPPTSSTESVSFAGLRGPPCR